MKKGQTVNENGKRMKSMIEIRPIKMNEWLPDRCLTGSEPFDPKNHLPECGCPSLNYCIKNDRDSLEQMYRTVINKYGGCGFIAWENEKIIAYHNFFPAETAQQIKFYGSSCRSAEPGKTLVHNCLTVVNGDHRRKGTASRLVLESVNWAKKNGWKRFEVRSVLPDCEKGWQSAQKSCLSFWERFGFQIFEEHAADKETEEYYGVTKSYSIYLSLDETGD